MVESSKQSVIEITPAGKFNRPHSAGRMPEFQAQGFVEIFIRCK
jgi:hypothetical protein